MNTENVSRACTHVVYTQEKLRDKAQFLADQLKLNLVTSFPPTSEGEFALILDDQGLALCRRDKNAPGPLRVDFTSGRLGYRQQRGGELLAKALGISGNSHPTVWDVTAGLGQDGWILASLGCEVYLFERHPVIYALLQDGLERVEDLYPDILKRLHLHHRDGVDALTRQDLPGPDVVYIDPMFPEKRKSAKSKKAMQFFQTLVGADEDGDKLLQCALDKARYRVIVKRPLSAPCLLPRKPASQLFGKTVRYDIYALRSFDRYSFDRCWEEKNNINL